MGRVAEENMKWLADSMLSNFPGCIMRVVYTDEEMWMEYVSEGIERIFGDSPEEYRTKINRLAMGHVASDSAAWGKEFVEEAVRTGKGMRKEYSIYDKNGVGYRTLLHGHPHVTSYLHKAVVGYRRKNGS